MKFSVSKWVLGVVGLGCVAVNVQALDIIYEERPPYIVNTQSTIEGFVATPLMKSLANANITYTLKEKPSKRHLHEIKANRKPICAIGWFKNPVREKFAQYTKPLYQDKPTGIITRKSHPLISANLTIDELLNNKKIIMLSKDSYSYGNFIDNKISEYQTKKRDVRSGNITMLTLVAKKRADFMFISYEEANSLLKTHPEKANLRYVALSNMPEGNKRYLICSFQVDKNTIEKINSNLK